MYSLNALASEIAKRESKKVSISIGNIREVLRILADMEAEAKLKVQFPLPLAAIREESKKKYLLLKKKKDESLVKERKKNLAKERKKKAKK